MEKKNIYTVDYFIKKFEAIPSENWCTGVFETADGRYCAQGFCGLRGGLVRWPQGNRMNFIASDKNSEGYALLELFELAKMNIGAINNAENERSAHRYPQPTPKQRILAALYDIKKLQEKSTPSEPKEEPEYKLVVTCSEKVKQLAKETVQLS